MDQLRRRGFLAGAPMLGAGLMKSAGPERPNILYIHSHDTGRYIQPYGHAVPTPHLERLAEEGVLFRQAFSAAPTCSPSRAALLTGQSAHSSGMLGLAHRGFRLKDYRQHIVHTLKSAGYTTLLAGVQHVIAAPEAPKIGYDRILLDRTRAPEVAAAAAAFLESGPPEPFFLDAGFHETHREYPPPGPREDQRYCLPPAPLPDTPATRRDMAQFKASARIMDQAAGDILAALARTGLAGRTLVIGTTDHGIAFPGMKCNLTDHGIGVMLLMRGPGGFSGGKVCDVMVSHVDVFPTLCDLLHVEPPAWLEGRSMLPLVNGGVSELRDEVFAEVNFHATYEPARAVRTARWKYIRRFDDRLHPNLPNCDNGLSKSLWLENGWRNQPVAREALYDLMFDPMERHNMAGVEASRAALEEMRGRLERWMRATSDPLLHGPLKPPPGARLNDPEGTSPREPAKTI